jgi:hypothetical protein
MTYLEKSLIWWASISPTQEAISRLEFEAFFSALPDGEVIKCIYSINQKLIC